MDTDEILRIATRNRLLAADLFAALTPEQWATPSLCAGWTVREVAAHLIPASGRFLGPRLLGAVIRYRGNLDRMVDEQARREAQRPTEELVSELRARATVRLSPPVVGPGGPMTDTCVHLRDVARPLGLDVSPPPESWRAALDFTMSRAVRYVLIPKQRVAGVHFIATDTDWAAGSGTDVSGTSEALTMAMWGRAVAVDDLSGPGIDLLRAHLA